MNGRYFLDTNIIVYSFDHTSAKKQNIAQKLIEVALQSNKGCISFQVVQECLNVSTRKFSTPLSVPDAKQYLQHVLDPLCEVYPSIELYSHALDISARWQYSFYDSLIIGSALSRVFNSLYRGSATQTRNSRYDYS